MTELEDFFWNGSHRLMHKWKHYFDIYERHVPRIRDSRAAANARVNMLEIGISHGGSLEMWNTYFGGNVNIYAVDINPECKKFETDNVKIFIGSQEDPTFLRNLKASLPRLDLLIDDGGHTMKQQIVTFEHLYDHIVDDGIYLCEDTHTSYWKRYGGGLRKKRSFIEYSKNFIDKLHAWHVGKNKVPVDKFVQSTHSLHFYDSILVIEKRSMSAPYDVKAGTPAIKDQNVSELLIQRPKSI
jgi:hypothetical protein